MSTVNAALAQAVALSHAWGLEPRAFLDTIAGGPTDLPDAHTRIPLMVEPQVEVGFSLDAALKDARLPVQGARSAEVDESLLAAVEGLLEVARSRQGGGVDLTRLLSAFEQPSRLSAAVS